MVINAVTLDNDGTSIDSKQNEDKYHARQHPHDSHGPEAVALQGHGEDAIGDVSSQSVDPMADFARDVM